MLFQSVYPRCRSLNGLKKHPSSFLSMCAKSCHLPYKIWKMIFASLKSYLPPARFGVPYLVLIVGACSSPKRSLTPTHQGALPLTITEEHYSLPLIIFICYLSLCNLSKVEIAPGHIPGRKSDDRKLVNSLPIITLPTPGSCFASLASS